MLAAIERAAALLLLDDGIVADRSPSGNSFVMLPNGPVPVVEGGGGPTRRIQDTDE